MAAWRAFVTTAVADFGVAISRMQAAPLRRYSGRLVDDSEATRNDEPGAGLGPLP